MPYWATEGYDVKLNGKSLAKSYQPGSYVEIPARKWSAKDRVEVTMPFTKHLGFGPDKMDNAPADKQNGKTEYAPMWAGTLMYGPLPEQLFRALPKLEKLELSGNFLPGAAGTFS